MGNSVSEIATARSALNCMGILVLPNPGSSIMQLPTRQRISTPTNTASETTGIMK